MKKGIMLAILAACFLTGCQKPVNYIEEGTAFLEEGAYTDAAASFEKSLDAEEDAAEGYRGLGLVYYEQQEYQQAKEAFQKALDNGGEAAPTTYNLMGICSMHLEDYDGALQAFGQGIAAASSYTEPEEGEEVPNAEVLQEMKYNEIVCYEKKLDWASAKAKIEEYIAQYPDDSEAQREAAFLRTR